MEMNSYCLIHKHGTQGKDLGIHSWKWYHQGVGMSLGKPNSKKQSEI